MSIGQWCQQGAHDGCTGTWRGAPCSCTCHGYFIDLVEGKHDLALEDRRAIAAFAAFLRHAATVTGSVSGRVQVHPEWHAWLTGTGPTPDPDSPVGPHADG